VYQSVEINCKFTFEVMSQIDFSYVSLMSSIFLLRLCLCYILPFSQHRSRLPVLLTGTVLHASVLSLAENVFRFSRLCLLGVRSIISRCLLSPCKCFAPLLNFLSQHKVHNVNITSPEKSIVAQTQKKISDFVVRFQNLCLLPPSACLVYFRPWWWGL
jgi:hypothetical protein